MEEVDLRRVFSILFKGLRGLHAIKRSKMRVSTWKAGPRSCSIASAEVRSGAGGSDIACPCHQIVHSLSPSRPSSPAQRIAVGPMLARLNV